MHFVCISHFKITNVASGEAQKKRRFTKLIRFWELKRKKMIMLKGRQSDDGIIHYGLKRLTACHCCLYREAVC